MGLSHREVVGEMLDSALEYAEVHSVLIDDVRFLFDLLTQSRDDEYGKHLKILLELAEVGENECPESWATEFIRKDGTRLISRGDSEEALKYFREKVRFLSEAEQEEL